MTKNFANFADFTEFYANETEGSAEAIQQAMSETNPTSQLSVFDEPNANEMPDPFVMQSAIEMIMQTTFDALRDTRLEEFAQDISWGFVNSLHMTAKRIANREDDSAKKLGELARCYEPSEIYTTELEETQLICQSLMDAREAMESMRDYAADVYRVETGRPWETTRGSKTSSTLTASVIDARDFRAARAAKYRDAHAPEGPIVIFSGGQNWEDERPIWKALDETFARIPNMILATTAQKRGADQAALGWAASKGVKTIRYTPDYSKGNAAGFERNKTLIALKPVHAIICEGTGIQANLRDKVREARIPHHALGLHMQSKRNAA